MRERRPWSDHLASTFAVAFCGAEDLLQELGNSDEQCHERHAERRDREAIGSIHLALAAFRDFCLMHIADATCTWLHIKTV